MRDASSGKPTWNWLQRAGYIGLVAGGLLFVAMETTHRIAAYWGLGIFVSGGILLAVAKIRQRFAK